MHRSSCERRLRAQCWAGLWLCRLRRPLAAEPCCLVADAAPSAQERVQALDCAGESPGLGRGPWQTALSRGRCLEQERASPGQGRAALCVTQTCSGSLFRGAPAQTQPNSLLQECEGGPALAIFLWDPATGNQIGRVLAGHSKWITCLCWEPLHINPECRYLASASKDGSVRIWDTLMGRCDKILTSHTQSVTCLKWGGDGLLYSSSQDRTIKVWRSQDGVLCRTLQGHAHWVNTMALSTDYVLRTGAFEPAEATINPQDMSGSLMELKEKAQQRYDQVRGQEPERLVSGSDDFTLFLWRPAEDKKPLERMMGHQALINQVLFSPDTRIIASASFDKSIKLWDGRTGKYLTSLRGHVSAVYQIAWSADSRLLVSGSSDSTLKVWDAKMKKLAIDLPGHADEVYATDWSPDGQRVASGGKDKCLRM
nr:PREDICTED: notchless protein homolog 1 [Opisthocomus hoazin]